ncbi:MAG: peptidylprolyl isomerase [Proteobacteria bacterium]|nr:peptidylprolyl isomerase [Pseudomonadota bacterium]
MRRFCIALLLLVLGCRDDEPRFSTASQGKVAPVAGKSRERRVAGRKVPKKVLADRKVAERVGGYELIRAGESTRKSRPAASTGAERLIRVPNRPDPHEGSFTLKQALRGLAKDGELIARIETRMGALYCELFEDKAPIAVANFVGLARGLRRFWDARQGEWVARRYYDRTTFHRIIPGFMIQGGDYLGDGSGTTGYEFPDEIHPSLKHDRPGLLCMANRGPNTNSGQFFLTDGPAPHLDHSYTIFGECEPTALIGRIARVPQAGPPNNRPLDPVAIRAVQVERARGGIKGAKTRHHQAITKLRTKAAARGASKGPSARKPRPSPRPRE